VELRPRGQYLANEVVAWQDAEGTLRYGVVASAVGGAGEEGGEGSGAGAEEHKGGEGPERVLELLVRTGPGRSQRLPVTQVYFFRATRGAAEGDAAAPPPGATSSGGEGGGGGEGDSGVGPSTAGPLPPDVARREGQAPPRALPVSSTQLLDAVDEMLGRCACFRACHKHARIPLASRGHAPHALFCPASPPSPLVPLPLACLPPG
jgi:hypothetical protein